MTTNTNTQGTGPMIDHTKFIVRRHGSDPKSETIATSNSYGKAYDAAMTYLMDAERDYECFDVVEVNRHGKVVRYWDTVSWEPRG